MIAASPAGAPGRCRPGPGLGAGYGTGSSFSYITAVLGSIRNTQCACATRWIVPLSIHELICIHELLHCNHHLPRIGSVYKRHPVTKFEHGSHGASKRNFNHMTVY